MNIFSVFLEIVNKLCSYCVSTGLSPHTHSTCMQEAKIAMTVFSGEEPSSQSIV